MSLKRLTREETDRGKGVAPPRDPITDFDEACANLVRQVLVTAGIFHVSEPGTEDPETFCPRPPLAVLDLGFGCGGQTWEQCRPARDNGGRTVSYVMLALNELQHRVPCVASTEKLQKLNQERTSNLASL